MKLNRLFCLSVAIGLTSTFSAMAAQGDAGNHPAIAVPSNDNFANRTVVTGNSVVVTGFNTTATLEAGEPNPTGNAGIHSVWWSWTAPTTGTTTISTMGSDFDSVMGVYTGTTFAGLTLVGQDDDNGGNGTSLVTFNATAGTTYQIQVNGFSTSSGSIVLNITRGALEAVPNDMFAHRITIQGASATVYGYNITATKEPGEPNIAGNPGGASVWWSWKAPANGTVTMATAGSTYVVGGSALNTVLGVYTGTSVTNLTPVASDDDGGPNYTSKVVFNVTAGTVYQIAVDGYYGNAGNITLAVSFVQNDLFANRIPITGTSAHVTGNNATATQEAGEPNPVSFGVGKSLWWTWTAPGNGEAVIDTTGSSYLTVLGVYTGTIVTNLNLVAQNFSSAPDGRSMVQFTVISNQIYQIMVDSSSAPEAGNIALNLKFYASAANDAFAHRMAIAGAAKIVTGSNFGATKEGGEPDHAGNAGGKSVWWTWTAPSTGTFTISTAGSQNVFGGSLDTLLGVYTGTSMAGLVLVTNNDNYISSASGPSAVTFLATSGTVYQIAVDGKNGSSGTIVLTLTTAPPNDAFAHRITISGSTASVSGSNIGATTEAGEPANPVHSGGASVWWTWKAPATGPVIIDTAGSTFDTILAVYTGTVLTNLTVINSDDDLGPGPTSELTISAVAGTTYQICVDGYGGRIGPIKLNVRSGEVMPAITKQPVSVQAALNAPVTFSVTGTGTAPLTYQWYMDGVPIVGATKSSLSLAHAQFADAGTYAVDVINSADYSITSSNAILTVVTETTKPTVAITAGPAANARVTNANVLVQGTASDNELVDHVAYSLNGAGFQNADGRTAWFASIALITGTNTFAVKAVDIAGNESVIVTRTFVLTRPITLATNQPNMGTITRNFTGNYLEVGKSYTVTAVPKPGFVFSNWSGTVSSSSPTLTFTMQVGESLQANFVPNPFTAVKGLYNGIFYDDGNLSSSSSGFIKLNATDSGSYSGLLMMNGGTYPFSGSFDLLGNSQTSVPRTGTNPVTLIMTNYLVQAGFFTGIASNSNWVSGFTMNFVPFNATTNKATHFMGKYTWAVAGSGNPITSPDGWGSATLTVDASGTIKLSGKLADGTPLSHSSSLGGNGYWPLYNSAYGGKGCIIDLPQFVGTPAINQITGGAVWFKPATPTDTFYPAGFASTSSSYGSSFVTPAGVSAPLVTLTQGKMVLYSGNLPGPITNTAIVGASVTVGGTNDIILTFNRTTGAATGSFTHPVTHKTTPLNGVILQSYGQVVGSFAGTNQIGGFYLQ